MRGPGRALAGRGTTRLRHGGKIERLNAGEQQICPAGSNRAPANLRAGGQDQRVMIGLLQRVTEAKVLVDRQEIAAIGRGLLVLVGIERFDREAVADRLLERLLGYRVFPDAGGRMNLSLRDVGGGLLLVPQFTLPAETNKTREHAPASRPPRCPTSGSACSTTSWAGRSGVTPSWHPVASAPTCRLRSLTMGRSRSGCRRVRQTNRFALHHDGASVARISPRGR